MPKRRSQKKERGQKPPISKYQMKQPQPVAPTARRRASPGTIDTVTSARVDPPAMPESPDRPRVTQEADASFETAGRVTGIFNGHVFLVTDDHRRVYVEIDLLEEHTFDRGYMVRCTTFSNGHGLRAVSVSSVTAP